MRFKRWLYAELQRIDFPRNNEFVGIFEVADRRIVKACFSDWPTGFSSPPSKRICCAVSICVCIG